MRRFRRSFARKNGGNVALMFALLLPVLVLGGGGVLDVHNIFAWRAQLQDAADAAAIASVARNSTAYGAALHMQGDGQISDPSAANAAQQMLTTNLKAALRGAISGVDVDIRKAGLSVTSTVAARANYTPVFLHLIGIRNVAVAATSHAADNIPAYIDFFLMLDNSPSMGLGATSNDITALVARTGCAFACHTTSSPGEDYYSVAKSLGVLTRIDVVRQATQQLTTTAQLKMVEDGVPNEFRMAVYDLGPKAYVTPSVTEVSPLTPDLSKTASDAGTVDLMTVPSNNNAYDGNNNDEDTNFDVALAALSTAMVGTGSAGDGASPSSPQKVLFFVTDGMVDMNRNGGRVMGGIDPASCAALKAKGIRVAILYTTYLPSSISNDWWSQQYVLGLVPQVAPALKACASPGLFYEVGPNQGIAEAMRALFQTVVSTVRFIG